MRTSNLILLASQRSGKPRFFFTETWFLNTLCLNEYSERSPKILLTLVFGVLSYSSRGYDVCTSWTQFAHRKRVFWPFLQVLLQSHYKNFYFEWIALNCRIHYAEYVFLDMTEVMFSLIAIGDYQNLCLVIHLPTLSGSVAITICQAGLFYLTSFSTEQNKFR